MFELFLRPLRIFCHVTVRRISPVAILVSVMSTLGSSQLAIADDAPQSIAFLGKTVQVVKRDGLALVVGNASREIRNNEAVLAINGRNYTFVIDPKTQQLVSIKSQEFPVETIQSIEFLANPKAVAKADLQAADDGSAKFPNAFDYQRVTYRKQSFRLAVDPRTEEYAVCWKDKVWPLTDKEGIRIFHTEIEGARYYLVADVNAFELRPALLRDLAMNRGILFTCPVSPNQAVRSHTDAPDWTKTVERLARLEKGQALWHMTYQNFWCGNDMKHGWLHPENDGDDVDSVATWRKDPRDWTFDNADLIADYCSRHGKTIRGHVLLWHSQIGQWVNPEKQKKDKNEPFDARKIWTQKQLEDSLKEHIFTAVKHFDQKYPKVVYAWDVANEVMDGRHFFRDKSAWYWPRDAKDKDDADRKFTMLVAKSFAWAHQAAPHLKLIINDYGVAMVNRKSDNYFEFANKLKSMTEKDIGLDINGDGKITDSVHIPIDGVGFQLHTDIHLDTQSVRANVDRFVKAGFSVHYTEMEVALFAKDNEPPRQADLDKQREVYQALMEIALDNPGKVYEFCAGFSDQNGNWVIGNSMKYGNRKDYVGIVDYLFKPKPAYVGLMEVLATYGL